MEHYRFHSRNHGLFDSQTGSRNSLDETSKPEQGSEGFHVLPNHLLHHLVYSMRNHPLAAMQSTPDFVEPSRQREMLEAFRSHQLLHFRWRQVFVLTYQSQNTR